MVLTFNFIVVILSNIGITSYEKKLEKTLIGGNCIHKLRMTDYEIDCTSDSEVTDLAGNKDFKYDVENFVKSYMHGIKLIYTVAAMLEAANGKQINEELDSI